MKSNVKKIVIQAIEIFEILREPFCVADLILRVVIMTPLLLQIFLIISRVQGNTINYENFTFLGDGLIFLLEFHPAIVFLGTIFFIYLYFDAAFQISVLRAATLKPHDKLLHLYADIININSEFSSKVKNLIDKELNYLMVKKYNENGDQLASYFFEKIEDGHYMITEHLNSNNSFTGLHARTHDNFHKYGYDKSTYENIRLNKVHIWGDEIKISESERENWIRKGMLIVPKGDVEK